MPVPSDFLGSFRFGFHLQESKYTSVKILAYQFFNFLNETLLDLSQLENTKYSYEF